MLKQQLGSFERAQSKEREAEGRDKGEGKEREEEEWGRENRKALMERSQNSEVIRLSNEKYQQRASHGQGGTAAKPAVPKLNLQVLPNYHKKSEKCLNDQLLAAYHDSHKDKRML